MSQTRIYISRTKSYLLLRLYSIPLLIFLFSCFKFIPFLKRLGKLNGVLRQNVKLTSTLYNSSSVKLVLIRGGVEGYLIIILLSSLLLLFIFYYYFFLARHCLIILGHSPRKFCHRRQKAYQDVFWSLSCQKENKQTRQTKKKKKRNTQLPTF